MASPIIGFEPRLPTMQPSSREAKNIGWSDRISRQHSLREIDKQSVDFW